MSDINTRFLNGIELSKSPHLIYPLQIDALQIWRFWKFHAFFVRILWSDNSKFKSSRNAIIRQNSRFCPGFAFVTNVIAETWFYQVGQSNINPLWIEIKLNSRLHSRTHLDRFFIDPLAQSPWGLHRLLLTAIRKCNIIYETPYGNESNEAHISEKKFRTAAELN